MQFVQASLQVTHTPTMEGNWKFQGEGVNLPPVLKEINIHKNTTALFIWKFLGVGGSFEK